MDNALLSGRLQPVRGSGVEWHHFLIEHAVAKNRPAIGAEPGGWRDDAAALEPRVGNAAISRDETGDLAHDAAGVALREGVTESIGHGADDLHRIVGLAKRW